MRKCVSCHEHPVPFYKISIIEFIRHSMCVLCLKNKGDYLDNILAAPIEPEMMYRKKINEFYYDFYEC